MSPGTLLSILAPSPLPHRMREFREPPQDDRPRGASRRATSGAPLRRVPKITEASCTGNTKTALRTLPGRGFWKMLHKRHAPPGRKAANDTTGRPKSASRRGLQSAACGSARRRAYPRSWSCGRVAEGGGLLNRYRLVKAYRGFESLRLRQIRQARGDPRHIIAKVRLCEGLPQIFHFRRSNSDYCPWLAAAL